ncbi:hypothetical protein HUA74_32645 [Myxococcus sp. CA051A]|uniref:Uncharacterized protein n=1 Tax=Myxococcus llanfairpwllgwyngyllgogerychwyrndrobwllllantysiliogogogochensis TaxID=2590453 RepID=A0A540WTB2_9BACT|nr:MULTISPECIES: hypothetical protein [Myxococcus]NTX65418.1 hypothetical protein [Myxococcus sp. CA051A]TQF12265.1 hypothetical protein FJV41_29870 [Myxococcus llanfairpwllgwyngyllgogerychwyrndrobwllllantysiliogogogochensis]
MRQLRSPAPFHLFSVLALATALTSTSALAQPAATPLEDNRRITLGYIAIAYELGAVLDPTLEPGGASAVRPNWFTFAPHASQTGGEGMLGTAIAKRIIAAARGQPSLSVLHALQRVGLNAQLRVSPEQLGLELVLRGLPIDAASSLAALITSLNGAALLDVRTLAATAARFAALYWSAPGFWPLDKAESIVMTLERTLHEGNLAIFTDIGGSGQLYLDWRRGAGAVTPERVLTEFTLVDSVPAQASQAYAYALAHAYDVPRPYLFEQVFPGMHYKSLLVAAFALYEKARVAPTPAERDALVAMGNNYIAWREQHDMAQPVFSPPVPRPDEVSRVALLQILTPLLRTEFGTVVWNYADYAYSQPDRDGNPLTSPPTEYNWAVFMDRWTGILYAFDQAYLQPTGLWVMPTPIEDPTALSGGS